ncbi:MAG: photosystem II stability/assembly factor-like uncharacterized protein [Chitinophagales bacterium]|jgi:photosystem II stability/assembly factor-like uncharacterized protein
MICFLCLILSSASFAQWDTVNIPNINYFNSSYFINDDLGFLLLEGAKVERTDDAGMTWDSIGTSYIYTWLNSAHFINENVGYIGGGAAFTFPPSSVGDLILKTTDGGLSFDSIYGTYASGDITAIDFADEDHGIFMSSYISFKTDDGGLTLDTLFDFTNTLSYGKDVAYPSLNSAYVGGFQSNTGPNINDLYIYKSINQGEDWNLIVIDTGRSNNTHMDFIDDDTGFLIVQGGRFYKTIDGGVSWTKQVIDTRLTFSEISFVNANLGFLVAYQNDTSYLYSTMDGGDSWQYEQIDTAFSVTSLSITDNYIYVGGFNKLYKRSIDSFTVGISSRLSDYQFELFPNPSSSVLNITSSYKGQSSYCIRDYLGRTILKNNLASGTSAIDISSIEAGVYTISISSKNIFTGSSKFIVK